MTETVDPDQARLEATCSCGDSFVSCDVPDDDERAEFDDWQAAHEHCGADHNHGCTFSWCINEIGSHEANRLEHFSATEYVPATADSRCGIPDKVHTADLPTIGVGVRFNEDLDPSPTVYLHIQGGWQRRDVDSEMRLDEAVLLHEYLGRVIQGALVGTKLKPHRIVDLYSRTVDLIGGRETPPAIHAGPDNSRPW